MEEVEEGWLPHLLGFLLPVITIGGIYIGGWWCASGIIFALGFGPILEFIFPDQIPSRKERFSTIPWNTILVLHSLVIPIALLFLFWRVELDGINISTILGALSIGIVSGVSGIVNAHEQGHRRKNSLIWRMARLNLLFVQYLHYTTEHNHGHHRFYATAEDPASAPKGRGLWVHILLTIPVQLISAFKVHSTKGKSFLNNPIIHGLLIQLSLLVLMGLVSLNFLLLYVIVAAFAIILLEYTNYLQHYGLVRGKDEKQSSKHSWESRNSWTRWTLLELPLHPAHHLKASDPLWDLRAHSGAPQLPTGYYGCFWLAIIPPLWKRIIDPRIPIE